MKAGVSHSARLPIRNRDLKSGPAVHLQQDPEAKARLKELWTAAYEEGDLKNLPAYLDETAILLKEAQELNFKRWKILDQKVHMNFQALGTYDAEVGFVRKCIEDRLVLFDRLVKEL